MRIQRPFCLAKSVQQKQQHQQQIERYSGRHDDGDEVRGSHRYQSNCMYQQVSVERGGVEVEVMVLVVVVISSQQQWWNKVKF